MRKRSICMFLCLAVFCGCAAVGPNYKRPELASPQSFSTVKSATAAPLLEEAAWWKSFNDPVLDSLMDQAARFNLDLARARIRVISARAQVTKARAAGLPEVKAKGSVAGSDESDNIEAVDTSSQVIYQAGFDVSWELDVFGKLRRQKEAASASAAYYSEDYNAVMLTLLGDVAKNYMDLRSSQELLALARRTIEARAKTVMLTRERARLGLVSYLDVAQAESEKASAEADVPSFEDAINQSIHALCVLLGKEPAALKEGLMKTAPLPKADAVIATGLPSELLERRPDLRRAERLLAASSAEIGVAEAGRYPQFDLTLGLGLESSSIGDFLKASSHYWSVVPALAAPLFDGGKAKAEVEIKKAAYDENLIAYQAAYHDALKDVENALSAYYTEKQRNRILAKSVAASEKASKLAAWRYRMGLTNYLDVLDAQRSLLSAQQSLSRSDAKILTSLVSLYKSLGGGWKSAGGASRSAS